MQPVSSTIDVTMREADGALFWDLTTQEIYPCSNYGIAARAVPVAEPMLIVIGDIELPPLCADSFGPAHGEVDLGRIAPGDRRFRVLVSGTTSAGVIHVTADSVMVDYDGDALHFADDAIARRR